MLHSPTCTGLTAAKHSYTSQRSQICLRKVWSPPAVTWCFLNVPAIEGAIVHTQLDADPALADHLSSSCPHPSLIDAKSRQSGCLPSFFLGEKKNAVTTLLCVFLPSEPSLGSSLTMVIPCRFILGEDKTETHVVVMRSCRRTHLIASARFARGDLPGNPLSRDFQ